MSLEEMIQHLYIAESILEHMAEIATYDSTTGDGYSNAAEKISGLIIYLERLDSNLKQMTEAAKPAEQPAPTEPTDKGFTLPPYSFPPMDTKTITDPLKPPYTVRYSPVDGQSTTIWQPTESQIEDQQARY